VPVRVPVTAHIGTTIWQSFRVDLVGGAATMTGEPETVPPPGSGRDAQRRATRLSRVSAR
jgi:hypothetical protein